MTIGFAATSLTQTGASLLLAADCRYSIASDATDTGIKTHALDRSTGAVVAGNALSVASAVELTRGIAHDHNRLKPDLPINFYSTVRLFAFFLDQIERRSPWSNGSEVVLVGFLSNGVPALAKVFTGPSRRAEVHLYSHRHSGSLMLFVGQRDGKEQIVSSVRRALQDGGPHWVERAVGAIAYLCEHEGEHAIGGAPSVAICRRGGVLHWPVVVMGDQTFLRGFDITPMAPPFAPVAGDERLHIRYDQGWHAGADQSRVPTRVRVDDGFCAVSRYVDIWSPAPDAFNWKVDPAALLEPPDLASPPHHVAITRPGEMSLTRETEVIVRPG
ncbi:MAG: hypothetical protein HYZ29_11010 [Myxococcales bacterium]|nr:hypothetical protein [Myxococcales bacterium]